MSRLDIGRSQADPDCQAARIIPEYQPVTIRLDYTKQNEEAPKPTATAEPVRHQAVIYARVSFKEQEKEGFSIPAQLKLLKEYAAANGFAVAQEYVDVQPSGPAWSPISERIRPSARYDLRSSLFSYFRPAAYSDELLSEIVSLLPDQKLAQTRLRQYLAAHSPNGVNLTKVRQLCMGKNPDPAVWECARWGLVSTVGEDMWRSMKTFAGAATLEDSYSAEDAAAIFRFGQYMALLKSPEIEEGLRSVGARKGNRSSDDRATLPPR
jgi:Resolvase, N terminal domain